MADRQKLSDTDIQARLGSMPGWERGRRKVAPGV